MSSTTDFVIENGVLTKYTGGGNVVIPAGVTRIGKKAFRNCKDLTISAPRKSAANKYAKRHRISFIAPSDAFETV